MKNRLVELLYCVGKDYDAYVEECHESGMSPMEDFDDFAADYLIQKGVIVPPCKVGDTLWIVGEYRGVYSTEVRVFFFNEKGVEYIRTTSCDIPYTALGKTAFLTREEAEAALAERSAE